MGQPARATGHGDRRSGLPVRRLPTRWLHSQTECLQADTVHTTQRRGEGRRVQGATSPAQGATTLFCSARPGSQPPIRGRTWAPGVRSMESTAPQGDLGPHY